MARREGNQEKSSELRIKTDKGRRLGAGGVEKGREAEEAGSLRGQVILRKGKVLAFSASVGQQL